MSDLANLKAPQQNRAIVAIPPLAKASQLLADNQQIFENCRFEFLGHTLTEIRQIACEELVSKALIYHQVAGESRPELGDAGIILSGHQPELFHPGVWLKNFALNAIATTNNLTPVNLIVDNDTVKSTALAAPRIQSSLPPIDLFAMNPEMVHFDEWNGEQIYEELQVRDEELFGSFPDRMTFQPDYALFLKDFWPHVVDQRYKTPLLAERFVRARRHWERQWGCNNLEMPVSTVCEMESYDYFLAHLFSESAAFHDIHNEAVRHYRKKHRVRSQHHPVPDLAIDGEFRELPFWAWRDSSSTQRRGRLMVKCDARGIECRVGNETWPSLPNPKKEGLANFLRAMKDLRKSGCKIRSRALTNTLFARLFLGDLFIHGLGGGKYDLLTNTIIERFYRIPAPQFLVLTGTLHLPLECYDVTPRQCRHEWRKYRDMRWNPQKFLENESVNEKVTALIAEKMRLRTETPDNLTKKQRKVRFFQLRKTTDALAGLLESERAEQNRKVELCHRALDANKILSKRDYSFCLYPQELLRDFMTSVME